MKRTLFIVFIILILICSMASSVSAQNGQAVFYDRGINVPNARYGIKLNSPYVTSGDGPYKDLNFVLNTGETVNLYIVPMNAFNTNSFNLTYYRTNVIQYDVLKSQDTYSDGQHSIHISSLRLSIGTYRLVAIGTLQSDSNIYEAYFTYFGESYNIVASHNDLDKKLSLSYRIKQPDDTYSDEYIVLNNNTFDDNFFTEKSIPANIYNNSKQVNLHLDIDNIIVDNGDIPSTSKFYVLFIRSLCLTANVEYEAKRFPVCIVSILNRTTGKRLEVATLNNINTVQSQSNQYPYALYVPPDLLNNGDNLSIIFTFPCYVLASVLPDNSVFNYSLKLTTLLLDTYSTTKDYSGAYNAMKDLDNLGAQLNSVERPELSMDDLDITDFVSAQDIANASLAIRYLDNTRIFLSVTALVAIFTIISYLFFGKKGA